jgi:glycyl-tRNA synthetase beta subunit
MSFLGQLPTEQWTDNTYAEAEYKLVNFSKRIRELQTLYISYEDHKKAGEDVDVYMLKAIKLGGKDRKPEVITIDSDKHEAVQGIKNKLLDTLDEQGVQDTSLKLAALAEFVEEYLDSLNVDNEFKENKNQIGG